MEANRPISAKIVVGSEGLGVPDIDLVEKRAWEVAKIEAHDIPNAADWDEARRELHGRSNVGELASLSSMPVDVGLGAAGFGVSRPSQTEQHLGEELFREGMEEAEHERMLLSRESEPEPCE